MGRHRESLAELRRDLDVAHDKITEQARHIAIYKKDIERLRAELGRAQSSLLQTEQQRRSLQTQRDRWKNVWTEVRRIWASAPEGIAGAMEVHPQVEQLILEVMRGKWPTDKS